MRFFGMKTLKVMSIIKYIFQYKTNILTQNIQLIYIEIIIF
jgi:hypothetical protein